MKRYTLIAGLFAGMLFLSACGGKKADNLDAKKAELVKLKGEYDQMGDQIAKIEQEIEALDSNATSKDIFTPVAVMPVKQVTFEHFVKVQGAIESENNIMVSPETPGMFTNVLVEEGQFVKRGQLLAQMDDQIFRKSLDELKVQLNLATILYEKQDRLWKQDIGSEVQLLQAKSQKESLEKRIATTEEQMSKTKVYAPISGVVEKSMAKRGQSGMPGVPAFLIVNLSELSFNADISEAYIPIIKRGDKVTINFPMVNYKLDSKISSISQTVDPQNRTVTVKVNLPGTHEMLKANMTGEIAINDATHENALTIPRQYLQKSGEGSFVVVAERNESGDFTARKLPVKAGMNYDGQIEILEGLKVGHLLITDGFLSLSEGQLVEFEGETAAK
jgi:RND family efflux transporter MFP subunit